MSRPTDHAAQQRAEHIAMSNATFCATLVDELVRWGVTHAVVCPGSRSTPLALALAKAGNTLDVQVHHDERSAAFLALGIALATQRPTVIVTTSGTAAVNLHPAIVEAHHAKVPLLALTADRPPELQDVGAPQTIDQTHLYGESVRWFAEPGPPDGSDPRSWRALAARAIDEATGSPPGPVHLNLAFREPLAGTSGKMPVARNHSDQAWRRTLHDRLEHVDPETVAALADGIQGKRGVIVAGAGIHDPAGVQSLAEKLSWPVLADARSGCRVLNDHVVAHFDAILRHESFAETARPSAVLRLGQPLASKVLNQWLAGLDAWQVGVEIDGTVYDAHHDLASIVRAEPGALCRAISLAATDSSPYDTAHPNAAWLKRWVQADSDAAEAITATLARHAEPTEPQIARDTLAAIAQGGNLVVSSSMPVRDLEWFGVPRAGVTVYANRGANGIDGVVSTALGVALGSRRPTVLLIGDVAFLHDANGLLGAADRAGADLTVVVVDNDGGGIFEFLPQAGTVDRPSFEKLFGTPHGVDIPALAAIHGAEVYRCEAASDVGPAMQAAFTHGGLHVVHVRTDRAANVTVHDELTNTVSHALFRSGA